MTVYLRHGNGLRMLVPGSNTKMQNIKHSCVFIAFCLCQWNHLATITPWSQPPSHAKLHCLFSRGRVGGGSVVMKAYWTESIWPSSVHRITASSRTSLFGCYLYSHPHCVHSSPSKWSCWFWPNWSGTWPLWRHWISSTSSCPGCQSEQRTGPFSGSTLRPLWPSALLVSIQNAMFLLGQLSFLIFDPIS